MITVVRVARVALLLLLALFTIMLVIGLGSPDTGIVEKVALVALIIGCVALAARVSTWAEAVTELIRTR
jgi:hypothetical protein